MPTCRPGNSWMTCRRCWRMDHLSSSTYGNACGPRCDRTEFRNCVDACVVGVPVWPTIVSRFSLSWLQNLLFLNSLPTLFRSQSQFQMQNGNADSKSTSSSPNPRFLLLTALNPNARYNIFPSPSNGQFLRLTKGCIDLSGVWTIEDCPTRNMRWDVRERETAKP